MSIILIDTRWHIVGNSDETLCGLPFPAHHLIRSNTTNTDCPDCQQALLNLPVMAIRQVGNERIEKFFSELIELYQKYGLSISHEDNYGAFIVEPFSLKNVEWMLDATLKIEGIVL